MSNPTDTDSGTGAAHPQPGDRFGQRVGDPGVGHAFPRPAPEDRGKKQRAEPAGKGDTP